MIWRLSPSQWITIPPRGRKSPNDPLKCVFEAFLLFGLQAKLQMTHQKSLSPDIEIS
nr:MAG TPA: hypothetical protein [Caudoviricetes sp.]